MSQSSILVSDLFVFMLPLQENIVYFKADESSNTWHAYLDYIDEYVVDGFFNTVYCSLNYFLDNTDVDMNPEPLFRAKMELQVEWFHSFFSIYKLTDGRTT